MKEERMKILQMVEDGKINVEEAGKLLEAMGPAFGQEHFDEEDFADRMKEFCQNTESFMKNVGCKIGEFAKDMEPRLRNVTKVAVSKTADLVDELGKALAACLNSLNKDETAAPGQDGENCGCCGGAEKAEESREN
jgi:polyhydroxyalkanoate synthesis regulator phasin